ncbi:MAG TPA: GlsB/YeaQ/YmgE family stress response membrane protein [Acidobacteriaceae bacterium]|nr:GlsB/YeaQ/YmgE family stress response membrane protein [Acidobacteriaceae bacterium]
MGHGIIAWIIIGIVAGWLTGKIMKGSGFGVIMDMVVGLVGALIGGFISEKLGFGGVGEHGLIMSIFIAVIGAVILTWLIRLITGGRERNL